MVDIIKIQGISKEFKEGIGSKRVRALEDLNLEIHKGEVLTGKGKRGRIYFFDKNILI